MNRVLPTIALPHTDLNLSALCLGTGVFGTGLPEAQTDRVYEAFRAAGGNCFDTAHCYCFWIPGQGAGSSERALGACIRRHGDAGKASIITKGGHPAQEPLYPRPDAYMAPHVIGRDIEESLERLGVAAIDLYFLHRDDTRMPVDEIIDMMSGHVAAGRIRAFGGSNWSTTRLEAANAWAAANGKPRMVASQPEFNLAWQNRTPATGDPAVRYLTDDDIAWHGTSGLPVVCYSPTAGGYFGSGGERAASVYDNPVSRERLRRATEVAAGLGVTVNQVALAWVMQQRFPVIPILGTASEEHLQDGLGAVGGILSGEQARWIISTE